MYISVITLYVGDVERAIAFYTEKLGWTKTMDAAMGPDMRWVTVAPPGEKTQFTLFLDADEPRDEGKVIIEVEDVEKTAAQLTQRGVEITTPPRQEPWGGWAMFKDSEGNLLGLHSPPRG
ncbi:MAG TPA: VOC family protein [Candidatus Sulfotelmatobacter sp.]|nr:VOC family protein [Candidatus Sulfotelmatobacter sp.]